ncbi:SDR family NAD(P)-dependent oxidoreductase [Ruixingdingia sedimenti]|uniref:SDR family oxidoreductase n=1 Tax=Ruixingdingia sedimenti TaxID=3073604 RepID=A0ABU1FCZ3_9RHOB|nr:SDR family oxidoreductase [Xinfangfangia sp. LG-4]MDR5654727.1 SDR family oxidoreductase [Xinfangfangia sp. LG-4]
MDQGAGTAAHARRFALDGKVALVTGAAQGIGLAIAQGYAAAGAEVVLSDRSPAVADAADALRAGGFRAHAVTADVTDPAGVDRMFRFVTEQAGGLDVLVNNAAILIAAPARRIDRAGWTRTIDTNLTACFFAAQAAAALMEPRGGGAIVNLSSIVGRQARKHLSAYIAAKAGIDGLTRALAGELAGTGITVNAIAPGFITTDMSRTGSPAFEQQIAGRIPSRRWGTPEDIAGVAVFLATGAASYVNGQTLYVDGGFTAFGT